MDKKSLLTVIATGLLLLGFLSMVYFLKGINLHTIRYGCSYA